MTDWLQSFAAYWTISITLLALGGLLLLRGLIGRRTRGKPLCRRCDYDLSGTPAGTPGTPLTCSECGHQHRNPRAVFQPRRFWKRAALGLCLTLLGAYALFWPGIAHRCEAFDEKWYVAIVPTTAWIWLVPYLNEEQIDLLDRRFHGLDWQRAVNAGGTGGLDSDGKPVFFEFVDTREPRPIPFLADWQKRLLARRCLVALAEPLPSEEVLESSDAAVREMIYWRTYRRELAVNWLGGVSDVWADAHPALVQVIGSAALGVERAIAVQMFQLVREPSAEDYALIIPLLRDQDRFVRQYAADTLAKWGRSEPAVVRALISAMREFGEGAWALSKLRPVTDEMYEALLEEMIAARSPSLYFSMVNLGEFAVPPLIESLLLLGDPDWGRSSDLSSDLRYKIQSTLSDIGEPAVPALIHLLDHPDRRIADLAMQTLSYIGKRAEPALPALRRLLDQTTDESERSNIEGVIGDLTKDATFD